MSEQPLVTDEQWAIESKQFIETVWHIKIVKEYWSGISRVESWKPGIVLSVGSIWASRLSITANNAAVLLNGGYAIPCDAEGNELND